MANRYAERLAQRGLVALSFDLTGFGLSGGEPREVESPDLKARDIESAVSLLRQHRAIDAERVGALAICASAGSAANASIHDVHLRALALIAPWLHDPRAAMRRSPTERAASTRG